MKRRVFVKFSDSENAYQILCIQQSSGGGDIYCTVPRGNIAQWHGFPGTQNGQTVVLKTKTDSDDNAHLSVHASGQVHIKKQTTNEYSPAFVGNKLADLEQKQLSVRHIFTIYPTQPTHLPFQAVNIDKGDLLISSTATTKPFGLVCFAVPKGIASISLQFSFHIDDIEGVPPESGLIATDLEHHRVFALGYRAKAMVEWPKETIILYGDGYVAPFVMGYKDKLISVEFREPKFVLDANNNLTMDLPTKHLDESLVDTKEPTQN